MHIKLCLLLLLTWAAQSSACSDFPMSFQRLHLGYTITPQQDDDNRPAPIVTSSGECFYTTGSYIEIIEDTAQFEYRNHELIFFAPGAFDVAAESEFDDLEYRVYQLAKDSEVAIFKGLNIGFEDYSSFQERRWYERQAHARDLCGALLQQFAQDRFSSFEIQIESMTEYLRCVSYIEFCGENLRKMR